MNFLSHQINVDRMVQRIEQLAGCSSSPREITRLSFTPESEAANQLVTAWMREAGMTVRRDELNNVIGRYEGRMPEKPALLIGSHLDTVINAGRYDGILGVIAGIEVVQTLFEQQVRPDCSIEIVAFCDEEGARFHTTLLGSRGMAGMLREEDFLATDDAGMTLEAAMREAGLDPANYGRAARDPASLLGYLELHIEQGPVLESRDQPCGIVSGIAGASRYHFRVEGAAGHAGTVPMTMRKDALAGVGEMLHGIERIAMFYPDTVATVGKVSVFPGASNVIPGAVEGTLDIRSIDEEKKQAIRHQILERCDQISKRRGLEFSYREIMDAPAVRCSPRMMQIIQTVIESHGLEPIRIASGAGHDAMAMASITEMGMIFVRCRAGLSHHPDEFASAEDIRRAACVLLDTAIRLTTV